MNKVQLIGRFTSDPEVKYTGQDGKTAVAHFLLAVDRRYKKEGDAEADFPRCVSFGKTAEFVEKYFRKGMKIGISGRLQTGSYEKDGQKHFTTDVIVEECEFVEKKGQETATDKKEADKPNLDGFMNIPDEADELPFN